VRSAQQGALRSLGVGGHRLRHRLCAALHAVRSLSALLHLASHACNKSLKLQRNSAETEHFRVIRDFLSDPERMLHMLFER
jgi:hypothetical protein